MPPKLRVFRFWCQKVLPLVYDDSLSYYEVLCKVVEYLNNVILNVKDIESDLSTAETNITELQNITKEIQQELQDILDGKAEGLYLNALKNYIDTNLEGIVGRIVKFISFGLTDDGYFIATIPDTWEFISFNTIMEYPSELWGHLVLNW